MGTMGQSSLIVTPQLVEHGIQTEDSNLRCHVAPTTRLVFVFTRAAAMSAINRGNYRKVSAYQEGVTGRTAEGYLVPPSEIEDLRAIKWHSVAWWEWFQDCRTTSQKGVAAVRVVKELLRLGRIPLPAVASETERISLDIKGTDILLYGRWQIQVKCDSTAGRRIDPKTGAELGSGNLFLQIKERNPLRRT